MNLQYQTPSEFETAQSQRLKPAQLPPKKSRKNHMRELDVMSVIMTFLVMFIHISSQAVSSLPEFTVSHAAIFTFWRLAMFSIQGFVFLSGVKFMLAFRDKKLNYPRYALSRFLKIIVPYVVFNFVYYVNFVKHRYFDFNLGNLAKYIIKGDLSAPFYFVTVITQFYALAPLWTYIFNKLPAKFTWKVIIPAAAVVNVLWVALFPYVMKTHFPDVDAVPLSRLFFGNVLYWTAGCAVGKYYEKHLGEIKKNKTAILIVTIVTALIFVPFSYILTHSEISPNADDFLNSVSSVMHMILCICSIPLVLTVSDALSSKLRGICESRVFALLSASTYYIYLIHCFFIFFAEKIGSENDITGIWTIFALKSVFVGFTSVAASMGIVLALRIIKNLVKSRQ